MISSLPPAVIYTRPPFLCVALCILSTFSFSLSIQSLAGQCRPIFSLAKIFGFFSGRGIRRWPAPPGPFVHTAFPGPEYKRGCQGAGKTPVNRGRREGRTGKGKKTLFVAGKRGEAISAVMRRRRRCVGAEAGGGAKIILRHFFSPLGFLLPTKGHPPKKNCCVPGCVCSIACPLTR